MASRNSHCPTPEDLRAFIAFELPEPVVQTAATLQNKLRDDGWKLRWVRPQNIHLTLKFMAALPKERVEAVAGVMAAIAQDQAPLSLSLKGLGVFPNLRRPRVLWAGLTGDLARLGTIQALLEDGLAAAGVPRENRSFKAHLTLARMPDRFEDQNLARSITAVEGFAAVPFTCPELVLFQSRLDPRGAVYTPLARVGLSGILQGRLDSK